MKLSVRNLWRRYGEADVLRGVDFDVAPGEIACLVGPNGAGKSTVLKCVNRILAPSKGEVLLDERPVSAFGRRALAQAVAYVPQQAGQAMSLPVIEMVGLGRAPHRGLGTAAHDRAVVMDAIQRLRLEPLAMRQYGELSGGERHRVLIARALAQEGKVMLLDEPTSDLDLRFQLEIMTALRRLADEHRVAILVAIHDLALASRFSDQVIMLSQGRVFAKGGWREVVTPSNLSSVYGVGALTGADSGLPYVIPTEIDG
ncbi:ABC transporter ATP-binding protein [Caulobacter endophyticus]|uniref:ABC transporter ATP-binding protein n=1 Tax=Caulobacter endophyticus TaxID=2172652 RepID=UPI00240FE90C|nr:ABC transporter ATP-binding protein [Caulobacter endophyticus]MDG2527922.1 ABC transporter ATP-binding protein [Caulobacter endophyticus]